MLTREEVERRLVDHERRCQKFTTPDTHAIKQALQTALAVMDERDALAAEGRALFDALRQATNHFIDIGVIDPTYYRDLVTTPLITAEVARVRRLEAVLEAAEALIDARGAHIEGSVPLKNAINRCKECRGRQ